MIRKAVVLCSLACLFAAAPACAADEPIGGLFRDKNNHIQPIKVFIKEVKNGSGQKEIVPDAFKTALEVSLKARKAIPFEIVGDASQSMIQITAVISHYQYLERGPFKPSPGIETTLLDAAATMTENYVEMAVDYTVVGTKTGETLWTHTINEYLKKEMTPAESIPLISDIVTRTFIWRCFGKANPKDRSTHLL